MSEDKMTSNQTSPERAVLRPSVLEKLRSRLLSLDTNDLRYLLLELSGAGRIAIILPTTEGRAVFTGSDMIGSDHGDVAHLEISPLEVLYGEKSWEQALDSRLLPRKEFAK